MPDTADIDRLTGQLQALRALLNAMMDTHPDVALLSKWFRVHAEVARTRNLNEAVSEDGRAGFEAGAEAITMALGDNSGRRADPSVLEALLARLPPEDPRA